MRDRRVTQFQLYIMAMILGEVVRSALAARFPAAIGSTLTASGIAALFQGLHRPRHKPAEQRRIPVEPP